MSALGDYIHLTAKHYQKYGTNRKGSNQGSFYNYMSAHDFINNKLNEVSSFKQENDVKKILEQRLLANSSQNI